MKKLLLSFLLTILCLPAFADEWTWAYSNGVTVSGVTKKNTGTLTLGTLGWSYSSSEQIAVTKNGTVKGVSLGDKNATKSSTVIISTDKFKSCVITEVSIKAGAASGATGAKVSIDIDEVSVASKNISANTNNSNSLETVSFSGNANCNSSFAFTITTAAGKQMTFGNISIKYQDATTSEKKTVTLTWSKETASVALGEDFEFPTLTVEPADIEVTYASSKPEVATIDADGKVNPLSPGTTEISATFVGNEEYSSASSSYALTVEPEKIKDAIIETLTYSDFSSSTSTGSYSELEYKSPETGIIYSAQMARNNDADMQIRSDKNNSGLVTTQNDEYLIKYIRILPGTGNNNTRSIDIYGYDKAFTAASELYGESAVGTKIGSVSATDGGYVLFNDEYQYFGLRSNDGACYIKEIEITYVKIPVDPSKIKTTLSFSTKEIVVPEGTEEIEQQVLTVTPEEAEALVQYSSSDENIAIVDENDGYVVLTGEVGTVTITASIEAYEDYLASSASYTISVKPVAATLDQFVNYIAAKDGAEAYINCDLTVTAIGGSYCYVVDENGTPSLIYQSELPYKAGDVIPGGWLGKTSIYNNLFEIIPAGEMPAASKTAEVIYSEVDAVSKDDINKVVIIDNFELAADLPADTKSNVDCSLGNLALQVRNNLKIGEMPAGKYTIIAGVGIYRETLQLYPVEFKMASDNIGVMHTSFDGKSFAQHDGSDSFNADGKSILIKFEKNEGHEVYYRYTELGGIDEPVETVSLLADDDRDGFTIYAGEPVEYKKSGTLEHYTEHTLTGLRSEVQKVSFSGVTGIEDITIDAAAGEAEYFNLQGVRVANPENGVFIVRRGNKISKQIIR